METENRTYQKISVKTINKNYFAVTAINVFTEEPETWDVNTNREGEGLWINGKQILGTCQFSAGKNSRESIRRYFQKY